MGRSSFASLCLALLVAGAVSAQPSAGLELPAVGVRVITTGDDSELVKTVPIARKRDAKPRVVMSLGAPEVGLLGGSMALEASAEVEVTTCLKANPLHPGATDKCTGKVYGYDPHVSARLVLSGSGDSTTGVQLGRSDELECSQHLPARNHHCVLVVPWQREDIAALDPACVPTCAVNLVVSAWSKGAKDGHELVIGADSYGPVKQDKGRVNLVTYEAGANRDLSPAVSRERVTRKLPIDEDGGSGDPAFRVLYSVRIDNPREGDQFKVDARTITRIGSLNYNVELPTQVIVATRRNTTEGAGVAVYTDPSSQVSELNGINCTQGPSAHSNPCLREKFGVVRIARDRSELFINVVQAAEAKVTTQRWRPSDTAGIADDGYLKVWRY